MPPQTTLSESDKKLIVDMLEERIRRLAHDGTFTKSVWKDGYENMSTHTLDGLSLWIGRKVVYLIAGAMFTAVLTWALLFKGPK